MTVDEILDGILDREGEGAPPYITPGDRGGRTSWGISERAHPAAWRHGPPTREAAKAIYLEYYVRPFEFVSYEPLRIQLIDFAVTSGVPRTVFHLQQTLGLPADGQFGPNTRRSLMHVPKIDSLNTYESVLRLVNNALVAARLKLIDTLTDQEKSQKTFEETWESRALSFLVL